jgi:choice-of-anchor B domain-containing protein
MRFYYTFIFILATIQWGYAQDSNYNMTLLSHKTYPDAEGSSCWGWTSPNGTEYAIIGLTTGTSIVSLANPANPVEVQFITGASGWWREMKVYDNHLYIGSDNSGATGVQIVNLLSLPNAPVTTFAPYLGGTQLRRVHTVTLDEEGGFLYLNGTNLYSGSVLIFDLKTNPLSPTYLGKTQTRYTHDSFVRNDTLWTADINSGIFSVYNVSNKTAPVLLATQSTPNNYTHNIWLSDDGRTAFTTDETSNAYVTAYDISDLTDIRELYRFYRRPTASTGVIPHNVHIKNDYGVTAYYSDGVNIIDTHRPENLIEVGHYDTYISTSAGFHGVWGVYPYFASGIIIASDIESGLWVFQPNYQRACYLEGKVTEVISGIALNSVSVSITPNTYMNRTTNTSGDYKTGHVTPGTVTCTFSRTGYVSKTVQATLTNGQLTTLDVQLGSSYCPSPTNLRETTLTSSTATIQWDAVQGATQYQIRGGRVGYPAQTFQTTGTSRTFTSPLIKPGKTYEWQVAARCSNGAWTDYSPLRTVAIPAAFSSTNPADNSLTISPNPVTDEALAMLETHVANATVQVLSMNGQQVYTQTFSGNSVQVPTAQLASGVYILRIVAGDVLLSEKFVK